MNETLLTIAFVVFVTIIFTIFSARQQKSSWQGKLVKKRKNTDPESDRTTYSLIFKTDKGRKRISLSTAQAEFDKWQLGDQAIKDSGTYLPRRV